MCSIAFPSESTETTTARISQRTSSRLSTRDAGLNTRAKRTPPHYPPIERKPTRTENARNTEDA